MSTTTETIAAPAARKPRKKKLFIVTLDGVPCAKVRDKKFGRKLVPAGGTLVQQAGLPEVFPGVKSANRAIARAERLRKKLTTAVCETPELYREFMRPGVFSIKPHVTAE